MLRSHHRALWRADVIHITLVGPSPAHLIGNPDTIWFVVRETTVVDSAVFLRSLNNELLDRGQAPVMLATAESLLGLSVSDAADAVERMNVGDTDVAIRTTVDGYRAALSDKGDLRDIKF